MIDTNFGGRKEERASMRGIGQTVFCLRESRVVKFVATMKVWPKNRETIMSPTKPAEKQVTAQRI
jgi:hypothetical protein